MPSVEHETLVDLFRKSPSLAAELLHRCTSVRVDHTSATQGSIDLSQVASPAYFTDAVTVLRGEKDQPVTGIIVEVQLQEDPHKRLSWPAYLANLRAHLSCDAVLLVIAPSPKVAAWARQPIEIGHPGFRLEPLVISFEDVPRIRNRRKASRMPQLATLSAIAHPELEIAEIAIQAIAQLPEEQEQLYFDTIMKALPESVRQIVEERMQHYEHRSELTRIHYGHGKREGLAEGKEQGLAEGKEQGLAEGKEQGLAEGLRAAATAIARIKLEAMSEDDVAAIDAVSDLGALTDLVTALGAAVGPIEARAAIDRVSLEEPRASSLSDGPET